MRYRLNEPIVAYKRIIFRYGVAAWKDSFDAEAARVALPIGAVLRVPTDIPSRGLIEAEWDGQLLRVFAEDIRSRGYLVEVIDSD